MGNLVRKPPTRQIQLPSSLRCPYARIFHQTIFRVSIVIERAYKDFRALFSLHNYSSTNIKSTHATLTTIMSSPNNPNASSASNSSSTEKSKANKKDTPTTRLETKASRTLTVLWNDLPAWLQDNQHIHSGYRPASNSYRKSLTSLTHLHNESVNIYTHLVGAVLALLAAVYAYAALRPRYEQATRQDAWVFACFFGGAVACLGMSAAYHTVSNHSERVARMGNRLDYLG